MNLRVAHGPGYKAVECSWVKMHHPACPMALSQTIRPFSLPIQQKTSLFFFLSALLIYFRLNSVLFYSFLQAVSALRRVRQTPDQGICSRKSREARKGVVRQPLAGSSELLNLLKRPNRCVSSWKDELVLGFCHPACIPFPLF